MRHSFAVVLTLYSSLLLAQELPAFGKVTLDDFAETPYDSASSSVILFDKGIYVGGYQPTIERHLRVKINSKEDLNTWGEYRLGNYFETTTKVKAATHFIEDGEIISHFVEEDAIISDRKSNNEKIVVLTNVREGCIVELTFRSNVKYMGIPSWFIQHEQPVLWSEYLVVSSFKLTYVTYGDVQPFIFDPGYKRQYHRWVFKNVPPFIPEALMPDPVNYLARLEFWERADSWSKINYDYLARYRPWYYNYKQLFTKRKIRMQLDSISDALEKVRFLSTYIKKNYKWNGYDTSEPRYSFLFEKGEGSSGDLNILLYAMLSWAGFEPEFVLISTRAKGLVKKQVPSLSQFNYVLCRLVLNGKEYLLDATTPSLPFDIVPVRCLTSDGFMVSKAGGRWIKISSDVKDKINATAWLSLSGNSILTGRCNIVSQGYPGIKENSSYETLGDSDYKKGNIPNKMWSIDSTRITRNSQNPLRFTATHFGSVVGNVMLSGEKIFIDPYVVLIMEENELKVQTREFAVDIHRSIEKTMMLYLSIPAGYKVESLPTSQAFSLVDKSMRASFKVVNDGRTIVVIFALDIRKTWFEREEYGNLRAFFEQVIAKQNEMIVLVTS